MLATMSALHDKACDFSRGLFTKPSPLAERGKSSDRGDFGKREQSWENRIGLQPCRENHLTHLCPRAFLQAREIFSLEDDSRAPRSSFPQDRPVRGRCFQTSSRFLIGRSPRVRGWGVSADSAKGAGRTQPEPLGPIAGQVKIGPMAAVAYRFPVARLVAGPRMGLRIGEALGQKRSVAKAIPPLGRQRPQGRSQSLGGQIGCLLPLGVSSRKRRFCTISFSRSTRCTALHPIHRSRSLSA